MARQPKDADNIQVFRGSLPKADVFAQNNNAGCCSPGIDFNYDKLGERTRFDNALAHSNPTGANDKYRFPASNGFSGDTAAIIAHINAVGVGAQISVLAIPTYAFVTGVGVHVEGAEAGLTFNIITRNGLVLPAAGFLVVADPGATGCEIDRTQTAITATAYAGIGSLGAGELFRDYFWRGDAFSLEADEIILEVATMPAASAPVLGTLDMTISVSYEVIHRADR